MTLCTLRTATVLSRDCRADFGRPLTKKVMSHLRDGPGVTAPSRTNIVPLTRVWNPPPSVTPPPPKKCPKQVLNPTPLNPTPATCHKRQRKLRCSFRNAALQKLHCNIGFSAVRKSFGPTAAPQQTKNCTAASKKLRCRKVALSCRFPAGFKPPRLGTHVSDLLTYLSGTKIASQNRGDRGGRKRARNHSAAEIAGFFASPAFKNR